MYCQYFIFCLSHDDNEKRWKQFLNILLEYVTFVLNRRLDFPKYFVITRFPKKLLSAYKTFALLYPMCSILVEDYGLGKCRAPARMLIESESLSVLEHSKNCNSPPNHTLK